jgi:ubiquinone/menaquinone biosynthesis C-methylase UbiE
VRLRSAHGPRFPAVRETRFRHPNESIHNRIAYSVMEQALGYAAGRYARGRLIDVGCGSKPWARLFAPHVDEHVGVDRVESERDGAAVDIVATAYEVPLPDGDADTVLLSAVLEHLERPDEGLVECHRLLKPGGHLIVTAPFFFHIHEQPHDFFRFSPFGLRYLLESAGFEVVEIVPLAGAWTTFAIQFSYAVRKYRRGAALPVVDGVTRAVQWAAARWDRVDFQPQFSWSHLAIARKPAEAPDGQPPDPKAGRSRG